MRTFLLTVATIGLTIAGSACGASFDEPYAESVRAYSARDYDASAQAARRAAEIDPQSAKAWFRLGLAEAARKNWSAAIAAYERVTELEPGHAKALHNLGNVYFRQGLYQDAAEWYARAIEIEPDYQLALFNYGWVLRQLAEDERAEEMFQRCLQIDEPDPAAQQRRVDCLYYLGTLRFRGGDYATAASMMEQVLTVNPRHVEARYHLGMSYRHLGRQLEAEQQLGLHRRMLQAAHPEPIQPAEDP